MIKRRMLFLAVMMAGVVIFCQTSAWPQSLSRDRGTRVLGWETSLMGSESEGEYHLKIGDTLKVLVRKNPDLTTTVRINPDGNIFVPLAGKIKAAGLTIEGLNDLLKEKLSKYIRSPDVTLALESTAGKKIVVLGEVQYPGIYTYDGVIDIVEAISLAGDVTRDAKLESIVVASNNMTPDQKVRRVNLFKTLWRGTPDADIQLSEGDVIYVPRTFVADFTRTMNYINAWLGSSSATYGSSYTTLNVRSLSKPMSKQ